MDEDQPTDQEQEQEQEQEQAQVERRRSLRLQTYFAAAFMAMLVILAFLTVITKTTAAFGTALLVAATAMACGALLGFLFGIPRSLQANQAGTREDSAPLSQNTNLEQISDWLTKILVGVGLVELDKIGSALGRLIDSTSAAFQPAPGAHVLAGSLLILPSVTGFMIGYIGTRTWLFQTFTEFAGGIVSRVRREVREAVDPVRAEVQQVQQDQQSMRELLALLDAQLDSRGPEPRSDALKDLLVKAGPEQREQAFQAAKQARRSPASDQLARRRTIPVFQALVEAVPNRYVYQAELGSALADAGNYQAALEALDKAIELRGEPSRFDWFEFQRARARIGLVKPEETPDPETVNLLKKDLAVAWQKPSFRTYVRQILDRHAGSREEYQALDRLRPYLPTDEPKSG
jgi:tetratricopeptide (TPR) repeat protein